MDANYRRYVICNKFSAFDVHYTVQIDHDPVLTDELFSLKLKIPIENQK